MDMASGLACSLALSLASSTWASILVISAFISSIVSLRFTKCLRRLSRISSVASFDFLTEFETCLLLSSFLRF